MNKKIVIVTGTGGMLGTGHFQRMVNLVVAINKENNLNAKIFLGHNKYNNEHGLPERLRHILTEDIPPDTDLIIRDMRDSSTDEIENLKKTAPVLTIDDLGEGKNSADHALYLLPAPLEASKDIRLSNNLFLYGYNFMTGIESLRERDFIKDIDLAIYLGSDPDKELISRIKKSIPKNLSAIVLAAGKAITLTGQIKTDDIQYAEILCRSKILLTHFGITMFEGHICGCRIAALNPSQYHSALTATVYDDLNILYLSDYAAFNADEMFNIIDKNLKIIDDKVIAVDNIQKEINTKNKNFVEYIKKILYER